MDKVLKRIQDYLEKSFGSNSEFIFDQTLEANDDNVWGINSMLILAQRNEVTGKVHYKPIFNKFGKK